jgi:uracil-DNA glycosylase family 4
MTDAASDHARRLAAALVETDLLLGIDAVPLADTPSEPEAAAEASPAPPTTSRNTEPQPGRPIDTATRSTTPAAELRVAVADREIAGDDPTARLAAIRDHHADGCPLCAAAASSRSIVFGEGDPDADLVFVGEAPGEQEDLAGRPFVGPAGELLDKMIAALGLRREDVYITNTVKTRPFENRTPRPDEAASCGPWLANELLVVRPRAIVALGGTPAKHLLQTTTGITRLRGIWGACRIDGTEIPVMPTFHPAFVLRQYTPEVRAAVWQDLQAAKALVDG